MDLSATKRRIAHALGGLMALAACAGTMQATTLSLTAPGAPVLPLPVFTVSCSLATTGPGAAATITIYPTTTPTGTNSITVTVPSPPTGMTVVPTGGASADVIKAGATSTGGIQFTVNTVAGSPRLTVRM